MIRAVDPAEAEKADFVVCMRVPDMGPVPTGDDAWSAFQRQVRARSTIEQCSGCGHDVLVDSLSPKTPKRICFHCAIAASTNGPTNGTASAMTIARPAARAT